MTQFAHYSRWHTMTRWSHKRDVRIEQAQVDISFVMALIGILGEETPHEVARIHDRAIEILVSEGVYGRKTQ